MKIVKKTVKQMNQDLIDSIQDEENKFGMENFATCTSDKIPTCKTASCMAGHIVAQHRKLAKHLIEENRDKYFFCDIEYDILANDIWELVTGKPCRLDFFGLNNKKSLPKITRKEAIAHIRGTSKTWPLIK